MDRVPGTSTFSPRISRRAHTRAKSTRHPPSLPNSQKFFRSSKIWTILPSKLLPSGHRRRALEIPAPFLRRTFGLAMSRQVAAPTVCFPVCSAVTHLFATLEDGCLRIMPIIASLNRSVSHSRHIASMAQYTTFLCLLKSLQAPPL
jgi:hypothetical protein